MAPWGDLFQFLVLPSWLLAPCLPRASQGVAPIALRRRSLVIAQRGTVPHERQQHNRLLVTGKAVVLYQCTSNGGAMLRL
ncbi:hypothetical protein E2C01_000062 [Portunus trituberculatus]|uniref:Secreted protein n=1 Tax=Portunus trituberculatus TaxID=210409 RepID=A0A5B7CFI5_PORTR|nr:hypothetical protein [Portunus trituberculatus]